MKTIPYYAILLITLLPVTSFAQGYLRSDYLISSSLKDEAGNNYGSGDLFRVSGRYTLPLSVKQNDSGPISAWSATLGGSYGFFGNKGMTINTIPDEIINLNFSLSHMRPISKKWYVIASLGGGIYSEPDKITAKSILVNGAVFFVYKLMNNLDVGAGGAITNAYGVPIIMPTSYLKWQLTGKYEIKAEATNSMAISASAQFTDHLKLKLVAIEMDGMSAVMNIDEKSMIYSSSILKSYLTSEYKIGKSTLYMGIGGTWLRSSKLSRRTLKGFWEGFTKDDNDFRFNPTGYLTLGFRYGF